MKKILSILLFLLVCKSAFADGSDIYVLKIEVCTIEDKVITGFVKINDYVIDKYLDEFKPETIRELLIDNVQYTNKIGEFSYFSNSIRYLCEVKEPNSIRYDLYQLQDEKSINNEKIKSIVIIDKKHEERELSLVNKLDSINQFWLTKNPIKIITLGGDNEYCYDTVLVYSTNTEIVKKISKIKIDFPVNLYDFFYKQSKAGEEIVIIRTCTE